ncbi:MAG TPA: hypothetical protein VND64_11685 [Pirellulales bacterium]|nr:hypothetical protein [Pirellulales bacterium]
MGDSTRDDSIGSDELLFRRILVKEGKVDPRTKQVDPTAFAPRHFDDTGISLGRAAYETAEEEASRGTAKSEYYVAILSVERLRKFGIQVDPKPIPGHLGHAEMPSLTYENRHATEGLTHQIRDCVVDVVGPFEGTTPRKK